MSLRSQAVSAQRCPSCPVVALLPWRSSFGRRVGGSHDFKLETLRRCTRLTLAARSARYPHPMAMGHVPRLVHVFPKPAVAVAPGKQPDAFVAAVTGAGMFTLGLRHVLRSFVQPISSSLARSRLSASLVTLAVVGGSVRGPRNSSTPR